MPVENLTQSTKPSGRRYILIDSEPERSHLTIDSEEILSNVICDKKLILITE